jgi:hypothetical protein
MAVTVRHFLFVIYNRLIHLLNFNQGESSSDGVFASAVKIKKKIN